MMIGMLLAGALFSTECCSSHDTKSVPAAAKSTETTVEAETLNPADAAGKAIADISAGKCRLYAVSGYGPYIPTSRGILQTAPKGYITVYVHGTSDAPPPKMQSANHRAKIFAKTYNDVALARCGDKK